MDDRTQAPAAAPLLPIELFYRWLAFGERGCSSDTIVATLTGTNPSGYFGPHHPLDGDDFRRCLLLIEAVPEVEAALPGADLSPHWTTLIEHIDELRDLLTAETPKWRDGGWRYRSWHQPYNQRVIELLEAVR